MSSLINITIPRGRLVDAQTAARSRVSHSKAKRAVPSGRPSYKPSSVNPAVLEETLVDEPKCKCEQMGLRPGMPVSELVELGSGCTGETPYGERGPNRIGGAGGYVCRRLDTIRRRHGK